MPSRYLLLSPASAFQLMIIESKNQETPKSTRYCRFDEHKGLHGMCSKFCLFSKANRIQLSKVNYIVKPKPMKKVNLAKRISQYDGENQS